MTQKQPISTDIPNVNTAESSSEVKKASFWISQIFILIATVLGVYLAATQGFKQAVQFDHIMGQKNTYYLQVSLKNELEHNIAATEQFLEKTKNSKDQWAVYPLELSTFIWNNMQISPTALELQPNILANTERFMTSAPKAYQKATTGDQSQRAKAIQQLTELVTSSKDSLLPALDKNIQQLEQSLQKANISL